MGKQVSRRGGVSGAGQLNIHLGNEMEWNVGSI